MTQQATVRAYASSEAVKEKECKKTSKKELGFHRNPSGIRLRFTVCGDVLQVTSEGGGKGGVGRQPPSSDLCRHGDACWPER